MRRFTTKFTTILVGKEGVPRTYGDVREVPAEERHQLRQAVGGPHVATILIADEAGRREILRTLDGEQTGIESRLVKRISERQKPPKTWLGVDRRNCWEMGLVAGIGVCLWLLAAWK